MDLLTAPMLSVAVTDADHVRGERDAAVTLVEYGDYECPYCGAARPVLAELVDRSGGGVRLVFRNFPLADVHPFALTAALAAEAAGAAGRFWQMHDLLLTHQDRLRDVDLARYADSVGVPGATVVGDAAQRFGDKVEADFRSGVDSGVRGTPTVFVNGRRYTGTMDIRPLRTVVHSVTAADSGPGASGPAG